MPYGAQKIYTPPEPNGAVAAAAAAFAAEAISFSPAEIERVLAVKKSRASSFPLPNVSPSPRVNHSARLGLCETREIPPPPQGIKSESEEGNLHRSFETAKSFNAGSLLETQKCITLAHIKS